MRGLHSTEVAFLTLIQWPQVRISAFTKIYSDVAEIYRRDWFKESGQKLYNFDRTHQKHLSRPGIKEVNLTTDVVDFRLFSESDVNFVASRDVIVVVDVIGFRANQKKIGWNFCWLTSS